LANDWWLWRHYFVDLPLCALGVTPKRVMEWDLLAGERHHTVQVADYLRRRLGGSFSPLPSDRIARLANRVRLVREGDTYASLLMSRSNLKKRFRVEGLAHLAEARRQERPIVLLGGHLGSNYTMWIALGFLGYTVYPIARAVDRSPATPKARQAYMALTYRLTSWKWSGNYLYADSGGHFPKGRFPGILDGIFRQQGICFAAIDFPPTLFTGKQESVSFLGGRSLLPVSLIHMAAQRKAQFLTVWDGVEFNGSRALRRIQLGRPLQGDSAREIVQEYANRLTDFICREPWQWMGLLVAHQFHDELD
jgi:hypothetical protein